MLLCLGYFAYLISRLWDDHWLQCEMVMVGLVTNVIALLKGALGDPGIAEWTHDVYNER